MLSNVIAFLESFVASLMFLAAFLAAYTRVLPMREWALIREGNVAAATVLGGSLIGFTLPLAEAVRQSSRFSEMIVWSAIALIVQLLAFYALRLVRRDAAAAIERGDMAEAVLLAAGSIALGLLNAACLA
jgi:putative membrane protein